MKALGKLHPEKGIWLYETNEPTYGDDEVLIRVLKTSICGTDLHIYKWDEWAQKTIPVPMTIGHEFVGRVEQIGKNVKGIKIGDRVCGEGHITCGICRQCRAGQRHLCPKTLGLGVNRTGCFAKYVSMPASNLIVIPDSISDSLAAIFDPLGNAIHTALKFDLLGEDVLITGAGPIGIMASEIAHFANARNVVITDINPYRLELARKNKKNVVVDISKETLPNVVKQLGFKEGFDIGLEMSGNPAALENMIQTMRCGGKIALLGILPDQAGISWTDVIFKSLTLHGIYGREMFETWYRMVNLIEQGLDLSYVITHEFPFEEFEKGFSIMESSNSGKIVLDWQNA